jgi:hypothetical protein
LYEAVGVVVHSGSAEGGHYYSYIKDRKKGKWYEFNDTKVSAFDTKNLREETFGGEVKDTNFLGQPTDFIGETIFSSSRNAYFIIYERKHPLPLSCLPPSNPSHTNGIPHSVYQHIWDENMLFMKTMYFYDPDYLTFCKDYLFLHHFERKLFMTEPSLTNKLMLQNSAALKLGISNEEVEHPGFKVDVNCMDMFDEEKVDMQVDMHISKDEVDDIQDFDPDNKDIGETNLDEEGNGGKGTLVDLTGIDERTVEDCKDMLREVENEDELIMDPSEIEVMLKENPGL